MKKNHIILIIQIFCLVSFAASMVSSAQPSKSTDGCQDPLLVNTGEVKKISTDASGNLNLIDENTQADADSLAGTCPKGFHCSCSGCPLFSDLDEDNFCDYGEDPDLPVAT
ncbi:MAG TPA: hypothetical protein VN372_07745 [Methanospirillum sp.]|nr:hypothetical protein [Methanospirillum sp.]